VDVDVFRPPTEAERAAIRGELGWPQDVLICLFLGRLSREKGLLDLIDAWELVRHPGAVLMVVGPDVPGHALDAGAEARERVARRALDGRVFFHGPTTEPAPVFRAADVYVQPSHWEAAPFAVIEAMATGLPIVASRVGGMAEYLIEGANARLVSPQDPPALAAALEAILGDATARRDLGVHARQTAVKEFSEAVVCARYAQLFRELAVRGSRLQPPRNAVRSSRL
jgi:UDP-glucose:(heptosyl)LPS alpha-1,3-glucosyltransferase